MALEKLARFISLPEVKVLKVHGKISIGHLLVICEKERASHEVCIHCAKPSSSVYDHRWVSIKDEPMRGLSVTLKIKKRRYKCKPCNRVFTEPIQGVLPRRRVTQRYCKSILWACEKFSNLKEVRKAYRCSSGFIYTTLFKELQRKVSSKVNYPWPEKIGIDEHFFSRTGKTKTFATVVVDMKNKRPRALVKGKTQAELWDQLGSIPGRENVRWVAMDMCDTYKSFVKDFFPKSQIVADKFHVLRLLSPHILRRRKEITPSRANARAKKLLLCSAKNLGYKEVVSIKRFLKKYPEMAELYRWKERLHGFYRIKGYNRARKALQVMLIDMAFSVLPEIQRLRRTLMRWKNEVLNYFVNRLTNARTEGFNNVAKLVQKQAFGYKSFENYKLRYLSICS